jgi:N-methylhydantoinase A/oxoprolinase/acetone carboxylase beta subunit
MTREPDLRLGIDVGGTHTDAAVLDAADRLVAKTKAPTTRDVTGGVTAALDGVLRDPAVDAARISHVMLGTTHATNAVLERRNLQRVAVLRLAAPATTAVRPLLAWPADLRAAVSAGEAIVGGGIEVDGRELAPLDEDAVRRFLDGVAGRVDAVAITGMFAPASPDQELRARALAVEVLGTGVDVSLSHEVGSLGLIERENATVLNAALVAVARDVAGALESALRVHGLSPTVLFAQNDGTLMGLDYAVQNPVLTIGSGPANSLRGAAFLSGVTDALVADVGGTSTDIGVLVGGFPRESSAAVEIGGIRTNFRMPDIVAIAIGGGTVVSGRGARVAVGPQSVGYALPERALIFGGDTATLTDAAVAGGRVRLGNHAPAANGAGPDLAAGLAGSDAIIAGAIDRAKTHRGEVPLVVVGGGSFLVPDALDGVSEVVRPAHYDVANAIGAAIAQVGGRWEEVVRIDRDRERVIAEACDRAKSRAIAAGADADHVEIVELDEIPLAYHTEPSVRLRVKAVGPLSSL